MRIWCGHNNRIRKVRKNRVAFTCCKCECTRCGQAFTLDWESSVTNHLACQWAIIGWMLWWKENTWWKVSFWIFGEGRKFPHLLCIGVNKESSLFWIEMTGQDATWCINWHPKGTNFGEEKSCKSCCLQFYFVNFTLTLHWVQESSLLQIGMLVGNYRVDVSVKKKTKNTKTWKVRFWIFGEGRKFPHLLCITFSFFF